MEKIKQELSYLILGQQGGENRIKILELLKDRSYNLNQLSSELDLNYRTVEHHVERLLDYDLIEVSGEGYGKVYLLSSKLEKNYDLLENMKRKLETISKPPEIFENIVEQTHDGLILLDENRDVIFLNESAEDITGFKDEELIGKNIEEVLEPHIHRDLEQEVLANDEFVEKMIDIETSSGEQKTAIITMDHFYFTEEKDKGYSLLINDIDREKTQREILDALMSHSEVMMAYLDLDFDLVYVNSAYADRTDYTPEELIGRNHFDLFPDGENKKLFNQVIEEGATRSLNDRDILNPDGTDQKGIYWSLEPTKDGEKVKGLVLSSYEISDAESR